KTLQCLALISHARQRDPEAGPFLIVAPTSVVPNWAAEAERFAPGLKVVPVSGTVARRGQGLGELVAGADAVVTSYTLLRIDFAAYAAFGWSGLLLDEAQQAKNCHSKVYQCARRLTAPVKIAITGTPMENNLMELWSLLSITAPGLFPSPERFRAYHARPGEPQGDSERLAQLQRRIKPLVLRRTKEQVAADLPPKQEQILEVELHPQHRKVYQTRLQRERQKVLGLIGDMNSNRFAIFRSLTLLRQLSLHAGLVDEAHEALASAKIDVRSEGSRPDRRHELQPFRDLPLADPAAPAEPARRARGRGPRSAGLGQDRRPARPAALGDRRRTPGPGVQPVHRFPRQGPRAAGGRRHAVLLPRRPHPRPGRRGATVQGRHRPGLPDQPQGGRVRAEPHRGRLLLRARSVVESRDRVPGRRPYSPHRAGPERHGLPTGRQGHHRGKGHGAEGPQGQAVLQRHG